MGVMSWDWELEFASAVGEKLSEKALGLAS